MSWQILWMGGEDLKISRCSCPGPEFKEKVGKRGGSAEKRRNMREGKTRTRGVEWLKLGTCESAVCVRIEYRIESGVTIRIRIESRIESAVVYTP